MPGNPAIYVERLDVVIRAMERFGDDEPARIFVSGIDVGDDLAVDDLVDDLEQKLFRDKLEPFEVESRRSRAHVGATGIGTQIALIFLSGVSGVALTEAWTYLKARIPGGEDAVASREAWLRELPPDEVPGELASALARGLDARIAELKLLSFSLTDDEITGTFETASGAQYAVTVTGDGYAIERTATGKKRDETRET